MIGKTRRPTFRMLVGMIDLHPAHIVVAIESVGIGALIDLFDLAGLIAVLLSIEMVLAGNVGAVARIRKELRHFNPVFIRNREERKQSMVPRTQPRQDRRARRKTRRHGGIGAGKHCPLVRQPIKVRRLQPIRSRRPDAVAPVLVIHDKQNIDLLLLRLFRGFAPSQQGCRCGSTCLKKMSSVHAPTPVLVQPEDPFHECN